MNTLIIGQHFLVYQHAGYIAGTGDGIVTVNGQPASRPIYLYEVGPGVSLIKLVTRQVSLNSGRYLFRGLDPSRRYLIMCRDISPNGIDTRYEPTVFDYIQPATDLTIAEQHQIWQQWVNEANRKQT